METRPYSLQSPPLVADLKTHAATITANGFGVSSKSMGAWPLDHTVVNGKRQPATAETWAYALVMLPSESLQTRMLDRMGPEFRAEVEALLGAADEAHQAMLSERAAASKSGLVGRGAGRKAEAVC